MKIILTDAEVTIAHMIAEGKSTYGPQVSWNKFTRSGDAHTNLVNGFAAEMAVAKYLNVYPDLKDKSDHEDLTYRGQTINVKSTKYPYGKLLVPDYQGRTADWYILVTGEMPEFTIRGVVHADEVFRQENIGDLGKGKAYIMEQYQLMAMEDWLDA